MSYTENRYLVLAVAVMVALMAFLYSVRITIAHDQNKPELNDWYRSLQSGKGPCCGGPSEDATHLDELQWRTKGEGYEVFVENKWIDVPASAIVPVPNKDGRALVWLYHSMGEPIVRCFMPGLLT
ncbi:hypothetical protein [Bradyrhizobium tunisiense]|uniref:hypothetical protein n=1 Tax=Bradyrhizobium tunisiense TaxID=3278709 RepID=UPI0035E23AE5